MTIIAMSRSNERGTYASTGGGVCFPLSSPSTGSALSSANAKAVLPPRLWPTGPSLLKIWFDIANLWLQPQDITGQV